MPIVIQLRSLADGRNHQKYSDKYLVSFNPDGGEGIGSLKVTADINKAKKFENATHALELWHSQSASNPYRPDGLVNRPLTSFNIELIELKNVRRMEC